MYSKYISVLREKYRYKVLRYLSCILFDPDTISNDCGELVPKTFFFSKRISISTSERAQKLHSAYFLGFVFSVLFPLLSMRPSI